MDSPNQTANHKGSRLAPFLALSTLAHGLIFALVPAPAAPVFAPTLKLALAQVARALPSTTGEAAPSPSKPRPRTATAKSKTGPAHSLSPQASRPVISARPPQREHFTANARDDGPPPAAAVRESGNAEPSDAAVLTEVRAALTRYFDYPFVARRRGWQGEVVLGFFVSPEGRIERVEIVRSSGHRVLDEAARTSLARVGNLPDYMGPLRVARHLQIPIVYRLAEG